MATEWYLLKRPHNQLSGFEEEALDDFAQEGFAELLDSGYAENVELYNYDLSECQQIKAVIQRNVEDTKLRTLARHMFVPIGTCKAGMYVRYKNRFWIIVGLVDDNSIYEKAILSLCNHLLTWMNQHKKIIQRWASVQSAAQYNNGETDSRYYTVGSDQLLIVIPDDDESLLLNHGSRLIIDRRCEVYERMFEPSVICDTSNPVSTYRITRLDSVLYNYQDSGHYEFMAFQDEQHESDGYYVIDGKGYWLCGTPNIDDKILVSSSKIEYDSLDIYCGADEGVFVGKFFDSNGNEDKSVVAQWDLDCDFTDKLTLRYTNNAIYIFTKDRSTINKSFELRLRADGYETTSVTVTVRNFI